MSPKYPVAFAASTALAIIALLSGVKLGSAPFVLAACAAILVTGLPHGTLDLALIQRRPDPGEVGRLATLSIYLAAGAAMFALWRAAPIGALVLFIAISVAHFAEDWPGADAWAGIAIASAVLSAPAALHRDDVGGIFAAMTGDAGAAEVANWLQAIAPVALAAAVAGIVALIRRGRTAEAASGLTAIFATLLLPPAVGFALYFCLSHSPRHFRVARTALGWDRRRLIPVVVPLTTAAIAIAGALFAMQAGAGMSMRMASATFMALSILTAPHMATPAIIRWIEGADRKVRSGPREGDQNPMMMSDAKVKLPLLRPAA